MQSAEFQVESAPLPPLSQKSGHCLISEDCEQTIHLNFRLCVHCEGSVRKF